ncbi:MAG: Re/Si-specific NAD(P)(+) transhydrogenase subunit alpha [Planctomycetaceae bacterium]
MILGIPQETFPGERRVAIIPASMKAIQKLGLDVVIEAGAGEKAGFLDSMYLEAGAKVVSSRDELFQQADIVAMVRACGANLDAGAADVNRLRPGQCLVAQCDPLSDAKESAKLAVTKATIFALELVPRITRAQSMDVLSSMATIAGYKGVMLAANMLPQLFPMMMTAAGTLKPSRVFVMGAGVAGLQAIASAKRLGAVVSAYDVRPVVKEQVESLGGRFVEIALEAAEGSGGYAKEVGEEFLKKQREMLLKVVAESDVVITTAAVPGKKAPILLTEEMVRAMPAGSVVVDLAAERGGNCALTKPGETVEVQGVTILGPVNVASEIPRHASQMYSNNVTTFLKSIVKEGKLTIDHSDEVVAGTLLTESGELVHPFARELAGLPPLPTPASAPTSASAT